MKHDLAAYGTGLLFGAGLAIGGMTHPAKVVGFLDITGRWDPTLIFVMAGAVLAYGVLYRLITRRAAPLLAPSFRLPTRRDIDARLVAGAALFGAGWGLGGFCPGPALTSLPTGAIEVLTFVAAMATGMVAFQAFDALRARRTAPAELPQPR